MNAAGKSARKDGAGQTMLAPRSSRRDGYRTIRIKVDMAKAFKARAAIMGMTLSDYLDLMLRELYEELEQGMVKE